jgi:hypothetical protein
VVVQRLAACIFCGVLGRKLTNEHLLPKAVADAFQGLKNSKFYRHPNPSGEVESWEAPSFEAKVRVVCEDCNNTWMSGIEAAAAPALADLVRPGKPLHLDAYQQRDIAAWGFLKGILYQHTGNQIVVPDAHVKEFFRRHQPPMKSAIWMVAYDRPFALTTFRATGGSFDAPEIGDIYVLTWSVGTLAFHIFGHTSPNTYGHDFGDLGQWLTRVWPSGRFVSWPPAVHFDDLGIERLHYSLRANVTPEVRALRERGIAAFIRSSVAGSRGVKP